MSDLDLTTGIITPKNGVVGVIVAAGNGTRMASITKGGAKELVPVHGNIPSIGYSILEALKNGIRDIVIVSNKSKTDLEAWLNGSQVGPNGNEIATLDEIKEMAGNPEGVKIDVVHQEIPLGLGHAVLVAKDSNLLADHEGKVYVLLPDEVFLQTATPTVDEIGSLEFVDSLLLSDISAVLTMSVLPEDQGRYGIADHNPDGTVSRFVEKPKPEDGIESLEAIAGRYFLSMDVFDQLDANLKNLFNVLDIGAETILKRKLCNAIKALAIGDDVNPKLKDRVLANLKALLKVEINGKAIGELQLTDAIQQMLESGEIVGIISLPDDCMRLDVGTAEGYLIAQREIENLIPAIDVNAGQAPQTLND